MTAKQPDPSPPPMDNEKVQAVYQEHVVGLQRFLLGILKDESATADALQSTFIKLMEKGGTVQQENSLKSWLFRVAFNEAMLMRRRESMTRRHAEGVAWRMELQEASRESHAGPAIERIIKEEDAEFVKAALDELSDVQRQVVEKRIYEGLKFREIAEELEVPLGTVLARMQSSLKKLKPVLADRHT